MRETGIVTRHKSKETRPRAEFVGDMQKRETGKFVNRSTAVCEQFVVGARAEPAALPSLARHKEGICELFL